MAITARGSHARHICTDNHLGITTRHTASSPPPHPTGFFHALRLSHFRLARASYWSDAQLSRTPKPFRCMLCRHLNALNCCAANGIALSARWTAALSDLRLAIDNAQLGHVLDAALAVIRLDRPYGAAAT
jgi:hypothetical protein